MRTVYVNGTYLPETEAKVSIFDRGFLMADGVYEVTSVLGGKLIDFDGHAVRLARSLKELDMRAPVDKDELLAIHRELVRVNGIDEGLIYLQITRGSDGDRDFVFPARRHRTDNCDVHPEQARPGRQSGGQEGRKDHQHRRHPLGTARYQDGAVAVPVDGQDDGEKGRCR